MTNIEQLEKAMQEAAEAGVTMLKKSQMAFDFSAPNPHDHHKEYTRVNQSGTVSHVKAKGVQHKHKQHAQREVEVTRTNVTVSEFFAAIKAACAKKGMEFGIDRDEFEKPTYPSNDSYYTKDGKKYVRYGDGEPLREYDGADASAQAETSRNKPYDYQAYIKNHDGSVFNEMCEFSFDDEKRGTGYYYQLNREADKQPPTEHPAATALKEWLKADREATEFYDDNGMHEMPANKHVAARLKKEHAEITKRAEKALKEAEKYANKMTDTEWDAATAGIGIPREDMATDNHSTHKP